MKVWREFEVFRTRAAQLRAAGVALDVAHDGPVSRAIHVAIEHEEGPALEFLVPYAKGLSGEVAYQEIRATSGQPRIWSSAGT